MILRILSIIFSLLLLIGCSTYESGTSQPKEVSIAHLKSLCRGDHYRIVNDYTVRGVVVATDWLGEMNKSAVIMDSSGSLEFAIDSRDINEHLPIYSEVEILCNGLMLARIGGKIELGAAPTGDFPLDNIDDEMFDRYIRVIGSCKDFAQTTKQFTDIGAEDISTLIRFENVRICDEEQGLTWCDLEGNKPVTTYRTLIDREGNTFAIRTLGTCHYATEKMPTKEISVVGIIDYSDNRYFLRIVNKWFI
jgi:hypothetical protein